MFIRKLGGSPSRSPPPSQQPPVNQNAIHSILTHHSADEPLVQHQQSSGFSQAVKKLFSSESADSILRTLHIPHHEHNTVKEHVESDPHAELWKWYEDRCLSLSELRQSLEDRMEMMRMRKEALLHLIDETAASVSQQVLEQQKLAAAHVQPTEEYENLKQELEVIRLEIKKINPVIEETSQKIEDSRNAIAEYWKRIVKLWSEISEPAREFLQTQGLVGTVQTDSEARSPTPTTESFRCLDSDSKESDLIEEIKLLHSKLLCAKVELELFYAEHETLTETKNSLQRDRQKIVNKMRDLDYSNNWRSLVDELEHEAVGIDESVLDLNHTCVLVENLEKETRARLMVLVSQAWKTSESRTQRNHFLLDSTTISVHKNAAKDVQLESKMEHMVYACSQFLVIEPCTLNIDLLKKHKQGIVLCVPSEDVLYARNLSALRQSSSVSLELCLQGAWRNRMKNSLCTNSDFSSLLISLNSLSDAESFVEFWKKNMKWRSCTELVLVKESSSIVSDETLKAIVCKGPARNHVSSWQLRYSMSRDGTSYNTLLRHIEDVDSVIFVIKDTNEKVFGFYSTTAWKFHKTYFGNGECFVFELRKEDDFLRVFRWSGENSFIQFCQSQSLAIGGGNANAIRLESCLTTGSSGICETFNSPMLTESSLFDVVSLEVWGVGDI